MYKPGLLLLTLALLALASPPSFGAPRTPVISPPVTVAQTVGPSGTVPVQQRSFYLNGLFWVFFTKASNLWYATSTPGSAWTAQQVAGPIPGDQRFHVATNNTHIFLARENSAGTALLFHLFTLNGQILTLAVNSTVVSSASQVLNIVVSSANIVFITYSNNPVNKDSVAVSNVAYTSWMLTQLSDNTGSGGAGAAALSVLPGGQVYAAFNVGDNGQGQKLVYGRVYNNGWGANETGIPQSYTNTAGMMLWHDGVGGVYLTAFSATTSVGCPSLCEALSFRNPGGGWSTRWKAHIPDSDVAWTASYDNFNNAFIMFVLNNTRPGYDTIIADTTIGTVSTFFDTALAAAGTKPTGIVYAAETNGKVITGFFYVESGDLRFVQVAFPAVNGQLPPSPPVPGVPVIFYPKAVNRFQLLPLFLFPNITATPLAFLFIIIGTLVLAPYFIFHIGSPFTGAYDENRRPRLARRSFKVKHAPGRH